jgi:hypothetical protein
VNQTPPQPDLLNLALAGTCPGLVARPLFASQASLHLPPEPLALLGGVCVEHLSPLALYHWPHLEEESAAIIRPPQADLEKLRVWPKEQKG